MVVALSFVSGYVGYAQLNSGTQAFAREVGQVSTQGLGFAYACNTLVIVLLQLVVLRRIDGHRRTRIIMVMSLVWAIAWLTLGASGLLPGTLGATVLVAACTSIFAFGETLMQPTIPPLVNDLAPDHLRGRYNAVSTGAFSLAAIIAPVDRRLADRPRRQQPLHLAAGRRVWRRRPGGASARAVAATWSQRRTRPRAREAAGHLTSSQMMIPMTTSAASTGFQ